MKNYLSRISIWFFTTCLWIPIVFNKQGMNIIFLMSTAFAFVVFLDDVLKKIVLDNCSFSRISPITFILLVVFGDLLPSLLEKPLGYHVYLTLSILTVAFVCFYQIPTIIEEKKKGTKE